MPVPQFQESMKLSANRGARKAEIKDIFSFTAVGHKHLAHHVPSEDRRGHLASYLPRTRVIGSSTLVPRRRPSLLARELGQRSRPEACRGIPGPALAFVIFLAKA